VSIVIVGGAGRVGSHLTERLDKGGYEVRSVSRRSGVNALTGEGLKAALTGAEVLIDVTNAPSFDGPTAEAFFQTTTRNLLAAGQAAGVRHHLLLSIVGADRLETTGYFKAKLAQEALVASSGAAYSILRSTQFFEFLDDIIRDGDEGDQIRVAAARIQPIAAVDAASDLAGLAVRAPVGGIGEVAGPDGFALADLVRSLLTARGDQRPVIADSTATYFGAPLSNETLLAGMNPRFGSTAFSTWLRQHG
jgi:uncharacterized protein YbjT (DUF2867 family)